MHFEMKEIPKIKCAAIKLNTGKVYSLMPPNRHKDIKQLMHNEGVKFPIEGTEGFLLNDGTFVDRKNAKVIAESAKQLLPYTSNSPLLTTDDLW